MKYEKMNLFCFKKNIVSSKSKLGRLKVVSFRKKKCGYKSNGSL